MRGALIVVAAVGSAACGRDSIFFEIHLPGDMPGDRVELFVGVDLCTTANQNREDRPCFGVRPEGNFANHPGPFEGDVFFRSPDDVSAFDASVRDDRTAWFEIPASAETVSVIAVATMRDDPKAVTGAAILEPIELYAGPLRVKVDLVPPAAFDQPTPKAIGVVVWESPDGSHRCVGAHVAGERRGRFIVPDDDHDCDGVPRSAECEPLVYKATKVPNPLVDDNAECAIAVTGPVNGGVVGGACLLGNIGCDEAANPPTKASCTPAHYCVPGAVCTCTSTDPRLTSDCLEAQLQNTPATIKCSIPAQKTSGDITLCPAMPVTFTTGNAIKRVCGGPTPLSFSAIDTQLAFSPSFVAKRNGTELTFTVNNIGTTTCDSSLDVVANGISDQDLSLGVSALAKFELTAVANKADVAVLLPVTVDVKLVADCTAQDVHSECLAPAELTDTIAGCAQ